MDHLLRRCAALAAALAAVPAAALTVNGAVTDPSGAPLPGARITLESASAPARVTQVYTGADGRYRTPDLGRGVHLNSVYVSAHRLGFRQVSPTERGLTEIGAVERDGVATVDFRLEPTDDVADQVAASAWLALAPDSPERQHVVVACTQCHQMPNERIRTFAAGLAGKDEAAREEAWRGTVQLMRTVGVYGALQAEHAKPWPMEELAKPENSFFNLRDEAVTARWLARHLPTDFGHYPLTKARALTAPLAADQRTVVRQYPYPARSFVRETAIVNGEIWVCDIARNRLGRLLPDTGSYLWYDVPVSGPTAPHTIVPDDHGRIWVSFLGGTGEGAAVFDPATERWRIYDGFPKGVMSHDISPGRAYDMAFDRQGFGWLTIISHNQVIGFNRDSGEVTPAYDLPLPEGETPNHVAVYGGAMTSDGNYWFAQYFGYLGRFNTTTRKVDHVVAFPHGTGPHRMVVGDDDVLYVGLLGAGQILVYDARGLRELDRVDLPDRASGPYSLMWDPLRRVVWVGSTNNDSLFAWDPNTRRFTEYPLGVEGLHIRILSVDPASGDLWFANSPIPYADAALRYVVQVRPGDR